jgi:UPF0755 protein
MTRNRKRLAKRFFLVAVAAVVCWCVFMLSALFNDSVSKELPFTLSIVNGDTPPVIEKKLELAGVLEPYERTLFLWWGHHKKYDTAVKQGKIEIPRGASIATMWEVLKQSSGDSMRLTFIEGWNLRDIKKFLESKKIPGDLYALTGEPLSKDSLEGYLFPDTYNFYSNATAADVVARMRDNFESKITPEMRAEIKRQGKTLHEIITMASIIEVEVTRYADRQMVSDIMWRRLRNGWPLQMDSTVNYITGHKKPSVSLSEVELKSPYNTYKNKGLPPGPIGNPGIGAINAALYPTKNNYWFFLTTPDGVVKYATDFDGHKDNRQFLR